MGRAGAGIELHAARPSSPIAAVEALLALDSVGGAAVLGHVWLDLRAGLSGRAAPAFGGGGSHGGREHVAYHDLGPRSGERRS